MNSSIIGKIEKAKRYAQERDRVSITGLVARFRGEHDSYALTYNDSRWHCTCGFFSGWGVCSHTMAMERILTDMVAKSDLVSQGVLPDSVKVAP
ncbi:MAG: hypothetical protein Q7O66_11940 [Dehalococcoidia bacterium]|nr:hypothetical protein [Dehalococcoidia bacterium]